MSSRVYVVGYEHYYDDYKRGEASASIIAVYTNERAAYLLAANHNLFAFLQRREYFNPPQNGLSPEARAILTTLLRNPYDRDEDDVEEEDDDDEEANEEEGAANAEEEDEWDDDVWQTERSRPAKPRDRVNLESLDLPLLIEVFRCMYSAVRYRPGEFSMTGSYNLYFVQEKEVDNVEDK